MNIIFKVGSNKWHKIENGNNNTDKPDKIALLLAELNNMSFYLNHRVFLQYNMASVEIEVKAFLLLKPIQYAISILSSSF